MKCLSKYCRSLKAAERYQNRLYGKFDSVKLVAFPRFAEAGLYVWEVKP